MKKNKKNKAAKTKKTSLLGGTAKSLRKLGKGATTGLGGMTTAQKVAGGAALVALGLSYWAKRRTATPAAAPSPDATAAEQNLASLDAENAA